jgi:predicted nucleic acid-binding protein
VAKVKLLIDTDIFIDYLNTGFLGTILESKGFEIYYSVITKKELLAKPGLKASERQAVLLTLKRHRIIPLDDRITRLYSDLRRQHPSLEKEDALIAATALVRKLPLVTRNWKHYKAIEGLTLFRGTG